MASYEGKKTRKKFDETADNRSPASIREPRKSRRKNRSIVTSVIRARAFKEVERREREKKRSNEYRSFLVVSMIFYFYVSSYREKERRRSSGVLISVMAAI